MSLPRLSSVSRVGGGGQEILGLGHVLLLGGSTHCHYVVPLFLKSQTNSPSSYHYSDLPCIISWI